MVHTMGNTHLDLREYSRLHATIHCGPNRQHNVMRDPLVTTIITQYYVSKGLKVFVETSVVAVLKELKQLHDKMVMNPKNVDKMNECQKKAALPFPMLVRWFHT